MTYIMSISAHCAVKLMFSAWVIYFLIHFSVITVQVNIFHIYVAVYRNWGMKHASNVGIYYKHPGDTDFLCLCIRLGSDETNITTPVHCAGEDEITCFFALHANDVSVSLSVSGFLSGYPLLTPEMHISTDRLCRFQSCNTIQII